MLGNTDCKAITPYEIEHTHKYYLLSVLIT